MSLYVVLVNYNAWQDTIECLDSLFRSDHPDFRLVVCDNGSADGSLDRIAEWAAGKGEAVPERPGRVPPGAPPERPVQFARLNRREAEASWGIKAPLVLIDCGGNLGFAGGNNVGLRYALACGDCDFAWLLNNDTVVDPEAMTRLVRRLTGAPGAGLACSTLLHYDNPTRVQALGGGWYCASLALAWHLGRLSRWPRQVDRQAVEARMSYPVGASVMVTREFLAEVGLMCEDYFLYFEELDWVLRGKGRFSVVFAPESIVYHKVGGSIGTSSHPGRKSWICDYWNVRNRIFFTMRWFPWALPTVYLGLLAAVVARMVLGRWDRVAMMLRLMCGAWRRTPAEVVVGLGTQKERTG